MKKLFCILIAVVLLVSTVGCTKKKNTLSINAKTKTEYKINEKFYFITKNKSEIINPQEMCKKYYPKAQNDILDKDREFITKTWGEPLYNLKLVKNSEGKKTEKTILIYNVSKDSPSALYIFILNNKVHDYVISEFNGIDEEIVKMLFNEKFK